MNIKWTKNDLALESERIVVEKKAEQMKQWALDVDYALWHGNKDKDSTELSPGFLSQATTVEDLDGTDSALSDAAGYLDAMIKMYETIPLRFRDNMKVGMLMDYKFYQKAGTTFFANTAVSAMDKFKELYVDTGLVQIIIGDTAVLDPGDTVNTHSRIFSWGNDSSVLKRVYSRGFSMLGEVPNTIGGVNQSWATYFAACVIQPSAVLYSEQITHT